MNKNLNKNNLSVPNSTSNHTPLKKKAGHDGSNDCVEHSSESVNR